MNLVFVELMSMVNWLIMNDSLGMAIEFSLDVHISFVWIHPEIKVSYIIKWKKNDVVNDIFVLLGVGIQIEPWLKVVFRLSLLV